MAAHSSKPENVWLNLGLNVILPAVILMQGKSLLQPVWSGADEQLTLTVFVLALSFPLAYGIFDLIYRRKWNFFSILGFIGILLTGGIGILRLPPEWVAIKEAGIPALLGLAILIAHLAGKPLIQVLMLRREIFDVDAIEARLEASGQRPAFEILLRRSNLLFVASFFLSAVLNFVLATAVVTSPAGTDAFNEQLGRMTLLSYPVIVLPTMAVTMYAMWMVFSGLEKLTGLSFEDVLLAASPAKSANK